VLPQSNVARLVLTQSRSTTSGGGVGEPIIRVATPVVMNAIFRAMGKPGAACRSRRELLGRIQG